MTQMNYDRRKFLQTLAAASAAAAFPGIPLLNHGMASANAAAAAKPEPPASFAFAFFTDTHIQPELDAAHGCQMAFAKIAAAKPEFAICGGDLVFDFSAAPVNFDPSTSQDNAAAFQMMQAWFQELIAPAGTGFQPVLASSWTVAPDGLTYTFHIRPDVKEHSQGKLPLPSLLP